MALGHLASHSRANAFTGSKSFMGREDRASAQSRIAASTPRTTYGKHKNKLLPLTGSQFLRNYILDATKNSTIAPVAKVNTHRAIQHASDSDDSPLSGADVSEKIQSSQSVEAPTKRVSSLAKSKSTGHRDRLPPKELKLAPGTNKDDSFAQVPRRINGMLTKDPISSSAQGMQEAVSSDDSDVTPAKRKAKAPLTTIRKRLRTPSSGHKSLQRLRRKMKASQMTPTGSQLQQVVRDGFERSELLFSRSSLHATKRAHKRHEPLLAGLQALTLTSGPLPEVDFVQSCDSSQLRFGKRKASDQNAPMSEAQAVGDISVSAPVASSNRRVSFRSDHDYIISAQLASVSAPRREHILSSESEDDGDDEDEDDNDDQDDAAADTYLDEDELPPEDNQPALSLDDTSNITPKASPEPKSPASNPLQFLRDASTPALRTGIKSSSNMQRSRSSGFFRRTRSYLNEVNEPIDDDFRVDEMLLCENEKSHEAIDNSSDPIEAVRTRLMQVARSSNQKRNPMQVDFGSVSSMQPRSILKNTPVYISSDHSRPEGTAAKTRRNSMIDVEETGYFSGAKEHLDQLESTPTKPAIIRKKSSSRFYAPAPVEVPYSNDLVPETTPERPDYSNTTQLHTLRRNSMAVWSSSAAPVPSKDLGSLTRSVSRENGTLSQSVRRRSSVHFRSPMVEQ